MGTIESLILATSTNQRVLRKSKHTRPQGSSKEATKLNVELEQTSNYRD